MKFYERVPVTIVDIEDHQDHESVSPAGYRTSIVELLEFMGGWGIKDQIFMLANTLTVAGYSQREIAQALGVPYSTYRNRLWEIRTVFKDRGIEEI